MRNEASVLYMCAPGYYIENVRACRYCFIIDISGEVKLFHLPSLNQLMWYHTNE